MRPSKNKPRGLQVARARPCFALLCPKNLARRCRRKPFKLAPGGG